MTCLEASKTIVMTIDSNLFKASSISEVVVTDTVGVAIEVSAVGLAAGAATSSSLMALLA